ncbi:MAG: hypothetical protein KAG66_23895, partial [Methylococcales bacterium]|nr:hypothetical protein [Methylococcales bacterium]
MNTTLTLGFLTPIHRLVGLAIGLLFLLNGPSSGCTVYTYPDARQSESVAMNRPSVSGAMIPEDGHRVGAASILTLLVKGDNGSRPGVSDDSLLLSVRSSVQAFVHCYFRSSTGRVFRILPNDDSSLTLFVPGQSVTFAVANKLRYSAGLVAEAESFLCL